MIIKNLGSLPIYSNGSIVKLSEVEQKLYDMILKRFIAVFFEHAQFEETTRITIIDHAEAKITF